MWTGFIAGVRDFRSSFASCSGLLMDMKLFKKLQEACGHKNWRREVSYDSQGSTFTKIQFWGTCTQVFLFSATLYFYSTSSQRETYFFSRLFPKMLSYSFNIVRDGSFEHFLSLKELQDLFEFTWLRWPHWSSGDFNQFNDLIQFNSWNSWMRLFTRIEKHKYLFIDDDFILISLLIVYICNPHHNIIRLTKLKLTKTLVNKAVLWDQLTYKMTES